MFCINESMNTDNCIKIIFMVLMGLIGYIVLTIGFLAITLKKGFELYNSKFDHLKDLLLEIKDKKEYLKDKKKNKKKKDKKSKDRNDK